VEEVSRLSCRADTDTEVTGVVDGGLGAEGLALLVVLLDLGVLVVDVERGVTPSVRPGCESTRVCDGIPGDRRSGAMPTSETSTAPGSPWHRRRCGARPPPLPLGAASLSLARRSHSHNRSKALDSIKAHNGTAMRSINHQAAPQVHPHMLHAIGR